MEQQEKQLLLKDLCARLPYKVNIQVKDWAVLDTELETGHINRLQNDDLELKPYLRPMLSMTEEEEIDFTFLLEEILSVGKNDDTCVLSVGQIDWLNAHHFDYRGLIEKGLAFPPT